MPGDSNSNTRHGRAASAAVRSEAGRAAEQRRARGEVEAFLQTGAPAASIGVRQAPIAARSGERIAVGPDGRCRRAPLCWAGEVAGTVHTLALTLAGIAELE